jgi:hypothetical protein
LIGILLNSSIRRPSLCVKAIISIKLMFPVLSGRKESHAGNKCDGKAKNRIRRDREKNGFPGSAAGVKQEADFWAERKNKGSERKRNSAVDH